jgi:hypothetical protein
MIREVKWIPIAVSTRTVRHRSAVCTILLMEAFHEAYRSSNFIAGLGRSGCRRHYVVFERRGRWGRRHTALSRHLCTRDLRRGKDLSQSVLRGSAKGEELQALRGHLIRGGNLFLQARHAGSDPACRVLVPFPFGVYGDFREPGTRTPRPSAHASLVGISWSSECYARTVRLIGIQMEISHFCCPIRVHDENRSV